MGKDTKSLQRTDTNLHSVQAKANKSAQNYNSRYKPLKRGRQKKLIGLKGTRNGGVSFRKTPYIFRIFGRPVYTKSKPQVAAGKISNLQMQSLDFLKLLPATHGITLMTTTLLQTRLS